MRHPDIKIAALVRLKCQLRSVGRPGGKNLDPCRGSDLNRVREARDVVGKRPNDGELLVAESFYTEAVLRHDGFVPAALGLGRIYRRRNELKAAIEQYEKVLRLDIENDSARRELEELQHAR